MSHVDWSVCLSVWQCVGYAGELQKRIARREIHELREERFNLFEEISNQSRLVDKETGCVSEWPTD